MPKSLSFTDAIVATAMNKAEAAKARAHPDSTLEKPRDVILAACGMIAERLEENGFSFLKSGPRLKRVHGDLAFEIMFQSDRNNMAGQRAAVWIHAGVSSRKLANWRRNHPSEWVHREGPHAGMITGGQIGNLGASPTWLEWDFADQATRQSEIDDAIAAIRERILTFFALFNDPASAVDILIHLPVQAQSSLLEYALSNLGQEAAEAAGRSILKCNPGIRRGFEAGFAEFSENGIPRWCNGTGLQLAALAVATNLDFSILN